MVSGSAISLVASAVALRYGPWGPVGNRESMVMGESLVVGAILAVGLVVIYGLLGYCEGRWRR